MAEAIAWDWVQRTAIAVARQEPLQRGYIADSLQPDFELAAAEAETLVEAATGLYSAAGPARAVVTDRAGWIEANIASFQRLMAPVLEKLGARMEASPLRGPSRVAAGIQLGMVLGWMSTRVLGQYDLLLAEGEDSNQGDVVYFVGPNVLSLEHRYGFPPGQFRLWLALHELTHRAQFTGVPWLQGHFVSLVDKTLGGFDLDVRHLVERLGQLARDAARGNNALAEGGMAALIADPEQRASLTQLQALMSLLEGHGDITMDRAAAERVPAAAHFAALLRERRRSAKGLSRILQQLLGIDAKMRQYEEGERFVEAVEAGGGPGLLARVWEGPEALPSLAELRQPADWISRVGAGS